MSLELSSNVLYAGKVVSLPQESKEVQALIKKLAQVESEVSVLSQRSESWKRLYARVNTISMATLTAKIEYRYYQYVLLNEVILPYLSSMTSRLSLSSSRFNQLQQLLDIATSSMSCPLALQQIDAVRNEVYLEGSLWRSELGTSLASTSAALWQPIIQDNRNALQSLSVKLFVLSIVTLLKPLLYIVPLLYTTGDVLHVIHTINHHQPLTSTTITKIIKLVLLLFVTYIASSLLSSLPSLSVSCLVIAVACFAISSNDELIKLVAPHLSPHFASLHNIITASIPALPNSSTDASILQVPTERPAPAENATIGGIDATEAARATREAVNSVFRFAEQFSEGLRQRK